MKLAVQIAAGIIMAAVVVGVGRYLVVQAQIRAINNTVQQMQEDMQSRAQARQKERDRARRAQSQADAEQMRAQADLARFEQDRPDTRV
jgi:uncharacterized protein HemX